MRSQVMALIAAMALVIVGCGKGSEQTETTESGTGGEKKLRIAVIPKGTMHEFWKAVHAGADDAAKELGVEVIWKGPMKEDDRDDQIKVVEDFVVDKVDGIVLAPLDDTALRTPVSDAMKQDIPVIIIDSGLNDVETVSFVATDNFKGGQMAGERLVGLLGGKGRVVMLRYLEGSASTEQREAGFMDVMKKNPGIQVLSYNQYAGATPDTAQTKSESLLSAYKKGDGSLGVDGVFTPNESSTFGMLRVLQDSGWAGKVKFVGFDASAKLIEGLEKGHLHGLVLQNPRRMGYLGVKMMVDYLKGNKGQEKKVDTGAVLVTKENMAEPDIAKLLAPPGG